MAKRPPTVVIFAVAATAAMFAAAWLPVSNDAAGDVTFTAGALAALAGMLSARRVSPAASRARWAWWIAAAAAWLGGQLFWDVYGVIGFPAAPNPAHAGRGRVGPPLLLRL